MESDTKSKEEEIVVVVIVGLIWLSLMIVLSLFPSQSGTNAKVAESEDVKYTVRRLMRGLASGRDAARQGYATSLCEILKLLPEFSVESFLDILATEVACQRGAGREVEKCEKGGIVSASSEFVAVRIMTRFFFSLLLVHHSSEKMAKQELRDNSIGRVFAFGVLARVLDQTRNEKRSLELTKETATQAATELFKIYHEKSYLRELVTEVVILMFKEVGTGDLFQNEKTVDFGQIFYIKIIARSADWTGCFPSQYMPM